MYQNLGNIYPESSKLVCKSHKLFLFASIVQQCYFGGYNLLPLGQRVQDKLVKIIDQELERIGCQKMSMTTLAPAKLWKKTGRWDNIGNELFRLTDRKKIEFCLGPTHEEVITNILATGPMLSYKRLPIKMYQVTRKFRDENSPKYGFLRSREFDMKDLYTFDATLEEATETYNSVCTAYNRILDRLGLDYDIVIGSTGNIGGSLSHEFQIKADIGEDTIHVCKKCGFGANSE
ncbi:probable proline--tRNA ligase, mitochondrial, partial [Pecten maximus]|uniref:probable proline--tRNA ligase, mitochondrial n=1 Tax=Pecten maximus TaxID=6579 RepID=UPI001458295A